MVRPARKRLLKIGSGVLLAGVLLFNGVAWMQAWAMTHFLPVDYPIPQMEAMGLGDKMGAVLFGVRVGRPRNEHTPADLGLAYEVHRLPAADGAELEGWYVAHPQPRGMVVLFHGYATAKDALLEQLFTFHDLGYATFAVDFQGSGGSTGNDTTLGAREAGDVEATVDYVERRWPGPLVLYGVSMGSAAVLRAAADRTVEPVALIVESPFDRLLTTVRNRFRVMSLPDWPAAEALVFWGGVQHSMDGFAHNPADYARRVSIPTLVIAASGDTRATPAEARAVHAALAGPKRLLEVQGATHATAVTAAPALWRSTVREFLGE